LVTGEQIAKLTVADNPDLVVYDVAILGDTAFVADYSDDNGTGTVYVFDVVTGEQVFKLTGPDAAVGALFGSSLAATDNFLLVGSSGRNSDTGAVYLYGAGGEVPLPASVWLLGSAFVLLGLRRRRAGARA
jgi:outer membrane protein assembly factor BamB